jgi:AraC-like DNA-binding protein
MNMKNGMTTCYTNAGEYMSSRILKGLSLAETVALLISNYLNLWHRLVGFCFVLQGGCTESYGGIELECKPSSVKFHPANLSLSFIAQSVGVHPVHLAHSFRRYYRCSVGEYVRRLRIGFACRQLSKTDTPLVQTFPRS